MNAIALRSDAQAMPAKIAYARELANSGLLPAAFRRNPANVLFAVEYGDMLGLAPMAAITGIHVIEGKPSASAGLISALVRRAGHKLRVTGDSRSATCQIIRSDDPDYTFSVTWMLRKNDAGHPNAEEAGLLAKGTWKNYPASMLKSRAITQCARDACEEALFGLHYTPEELGAEVDEDGRVVGGTIEGEPGAQQPSGVQEDGEDPWYIRPAAEADPGWLDAAIERAITLETPDACGDLWKQTAAQHRAGHITDDDRRQLEALITARRDDLLETPEPAPADEVVEGVVVEGLEPEDPWAAKIETITDEDDADAARADVEAAVKARSLTRQRGEQVKAAIDARLASLGRAA